MAGEQRTTRGSNDGAAVELMLHYANAHPSEQTWRGVVLGPGVAFEPTGAGSTPFGVRSLEEFTAIQAELRALLDRVIALESPYAETARDIAREITDAARPRFSGWSFSPISEKLFELWDTENTSFSELVFFTVAQSLKEISFRDLHRCEACANFFAGTSKRDRKFCSNACRSRITVRRHREMLASARRRPSAQPPQSAGGGARKRRRSRR